MDLFSVLWNVIYFILWLVWSILWWILSFFIGPLIFFLFLCLIALRYAYKTDYFKPKIDAYFSRLGDRGKDWFGHFLYIITIMPFRVLGHLMWLVPLHAMVNLLWSPKWKPIDRAMEYSRLKNKRKTAKS